MATPNAHRTEDAEPPPTYDIVGCGAVVQQYHLPVLKLLQSRSELRVAGCYDRNPREARRVASLLGCERWATDVQPQEGDGVDVALVATPPSSHSVIARPYLRAGKSVFVEKPFTRTVSEARELVDESQSHGVALAVNQFWRFYPSADIARRWLRGQLDHVTAVEAFEGSRLDWLPSSDYMIEDPYGGVFHDMGAHMVDIVLYILGLDEAGDGVSVEVREAVKIPPAEPAQEARARIDLHAPGGQRIDTTLMISRLRPLARGVKIRGSFGVLFVPVDIAPAPTLFNSGEAFELLGATSGPVPRDLEGCFLLAHRDFLRAVREPGTMVRLDARRFVLLGEILDALHAG